MGVLLPLFLSPLIYMQKEISAPLQFWNTSAFYSYCDTSDSEIWQATFHYWAVTAHVWHTLLLSCQHFSLNAWTWWALTSSCHHEVSMLGQCPGPTFSRSAGYPSCWPSFVLHPSCTTESVWDGPGILVYELFGYMDSLCCRSRQLSVYMFFYSLFLSPSTLTAPNSANTPTKSVPTFRFWVS